jgi:hypothetical protein
MRSTNSPANVMKEVMKFDDRFDVESLQSDWHLCVGWRFIPALLNRGQKEYTSLCDLSAAFSNKDLFVPGQGEVKSTLLGLLLDHAIYNTLPTSNGIIFSPSTVPSQKLRNTPILITPIRKIPKQLQSHPQRKCHYLLTINGIFFCDNSLFAI